MDLSLHAVEQRWEDRKFNFELILSTLATWSMITNGNQRTFSVILESIFLNNFVQKKGTK